MYRSLLVVTLLVVGFTASAQTVKDIGDGSVFKCIVEEGYFPYLGVVEDIESGSYYEADIEDGLFIIKRRIRVAKRRLRKARRRLRRARSVDARNRWAAQFEQSKQEILDLQNMKAEVVQCDEDGLEDKEPSTTTEPSGGGTGEEVVPSSACEAITSSSTRSQPPIARIINGNACSGASPVVELLLGNGNGSYFSRCSGTVVSNRGIVTAAHCFAPGQQSVQEVLIRTGNISVPASSFGAHPSWESSPGDNVVERHDVAYVIASQDLAVNQVPILANNDLVVGESVLIAGYGLTETDVINNTDSEGLRAGYMSLNSFESTSIIALFDGRTGSNSCSGDSGGPLMVQRSGTWYLAGVTSNGDNQYCGAGGDSDTSRWANINLSTNRSFLQEHLGI
jgi:V8-like Glu-specific endopeptidase